ncbi:MAG: glutamine-hydrolyzing carbamoyl-phosphate synthase small subunit [Candidatus Norongarragalinales archaeon]
MPLSSVSSRSLSKASAALFLDDNSVILGQALGAEGYSTGELVFTTSMMGFQESLSDPSYAGQILTFAYPLIGNYGVGESAFESFENKVWANGVVVREACKTPTHYASRKSLDALLKEQGVSGIAGVDSRAIVRKIREHGVLPSALVTWKGAINESDFGNVKENALKQLEKFDYAGVNFVERVSEKKLQTFAAKNEKFRVALMDYGAKTSQVHNLLARGCSVTVFPHFTKAEEVLKNDFDGIMLSNGPGDPVVCAKEVAEIKKLLGKKPVFGICLGHQLLASALGAKTFKLKFGHRGANHAVRDVNTERAFVTSQNHGYAVDAKSLPKEAEETLVNCLDGTNEGLRHKELPAFSIQFHPEANPGPYDAAFYFEEFLKLMK